MKRFWVTVLMTATLVISALPNSYAAVTPGSKCSKAGDKQDYKGKTYTCIKSGNKLAWDKGVNVDKYDGAFAAAFLAEAKDEAEQILADAKLRASQISTPPNCAVANSQAFVSIGGDPSTGVIALIYENPGICDVVVRASAEFYCPRGQGGNNTVISRGTFPLKARVKLYVSLNPQRYFPLVTLECAQLTGYTSNTISVANELTRRTAPRVIVESSVFSGVFNQSEATKKANEIIKSAQSRVNKIISDAKNPVFIKRAWDGRLKRAAAEAAAAEAAAAEAAEKAAADAKAAAEKAAADAKAAAEAAEKAAADAKAAAENARDEALGKACVVGGSCKVGRTGPGGGIVFYDAGTQQSWGRYLEFAPSDWTAGNKKTQWCGKTDYLVGALDQKIGSGKANTDLILKSCTSGAAVMARAYKGGGKDDWSLPSKDELSALHYYDRSRPDSCCTFPFGRGISYWSSSENSATGAWYRTFGYGYEGASVKQADDFYVRPIRAF